MYKTIQLDKARNFKYGLRALGEIEEKTGKTIYELNFRNFRTSTTIKEKIIVIWAGLVHEDKDLTPDSLLDIMEEKKISMADILPTMFEAIDAAFDGENKNPPEAAGE